ncbi:glycosyltransferase family 2 protein [Verrucomicrobiales bacterium]|nr:glycosyltransferase family 2 protein [Verrucomicrobiales bacterium]
MLSYSIIVETDNLPTIPWEEFADLVDQLTTQIDCATAENFAPQPEILFVFGGAEDETPEFLATILERFPDLSAVASIRALGVKDARYYEMKNAGARAAKHEIIVFLDSDVILLPGWLTEILKPFSGASTSGKPILSLGATFLDCDDWVSRTFALIWIFPLRKHDQKRIQNRAIFANNLATLREWFNANPFPDNDGFKVGCTLFFRNANHHDVEVFRPEAHALHRPLRGARFLCWRALVTGRDADRKYALLKHPGRPRRGWHAIRRSWSNAFRVPRRICRNFRTVKLPAWQIPQAVLLGWGFYGIASFEQLLSAAGLSRQRKIGGPERIPEWVDRS